MAQIWMDEENIGANVVPRSSRKILNNPLQQSIRKKVLTKLDNVQFNKPNLTPFKGGLNQLRPPTFPPKISLCKETLQKQHLKRQLMQENPAPIRVNQRGVTRNLYARSADPNDDFDLFDFMDFPNTKCLKNCNKPVSEGYLPPLLCAELIDKLLGNIEIEEGPTVEYMPTYSELDIDVNKSDLKHLNYASDDDPMDPCIDYIAPVMPADISEEFDLF